MVCTIISDGGELLRQCKNEHEKPYTEIKEKLRQIIWELYKCGFDTFYLNCEYGVPLWAAEIICAMKIYSDIELHIVTPYEEQAVNWCEEHRERYFKVHSKADGVVMASTQYYDGCYEKADDMMIAESDLLAVFGGKGKRTRTESSVKENNVKIMYF